jgi:uncharacterized protein (TIGR03086 family)
MTQWEVLEEAHEALRQAAAGVPDAGWTLETPCAQWNVAQVLEHAILDQSGFAIAITGAERPAGDSFAPTGELGDDPVGLTGHWCGAAASAWSTISPDQTEVPVPVPPFKLPAAVGAGAAALDAAVHSWDIAVATGQKHHLTDALAAQLIPVAEAIVEPLREWGAYGPVVAVAAEAPAADRLLGYLGRNPDWTP